MTMSKKRTFLSPSQKRSVYEMRLAGESVKDIMAAFDISEPYAYRIIKAEREKQDQGDNDMGRREMVIAGDRKNGRLVSLGDRTYKGTCLVGASMKSREFTSLNANMAKKAWQKWCDKLREEEAAFLANCEPRVDGQDAIETKPEEHEQEETFVVSTDQWTMPGDDEPVYVAPAQIPDIDMRPWKDVAEERARRIEELEKKVQYLEGRIEGYESMPSSRVGDAVYLLWAKSEEPKVFGLYPSMEKALKEVDRLNEVASFLMGANVFEVEEVEWK